MKAQVSVEFMIIAILLLGTISTISVMSIIKSREIEIFNVRLEAENVLTNTANRINTVYLEGEGFIINVTLPQSIRGFNYSVSTNSNFLVITVLTESFSRNLITNVTGNLAKGSNMLKNVNGEVRVL